MSSSAVGNSPSEVEIARRSPFLLETAERPGWLPLQVVVVLQVAMTVALLIALAFRFDWRAIGDQLAAANHGLVLGAVAAHGLVLVVGAFNFWVLLRAVERVSLAFTVRSYVLSWSTFLLMPGSFGDASIVLFLREGGVGYRNAALAYVADKQITLALVLAVALGGGVFYFPTFTPPWLLAGGAVAGALVAVPAYLWIRCTSSPWVARLRSALAALSVFARTHRRRLALNATGTAVKMTFTGLAHWCALLAVGADVAPGLVLTVAFLSGLVAYLPVAYNGIGTVEATSVALYGIKGVPQAEVLAAWVILRIGVFALAGLGLAASHVSRLGGGGRGQS